MRILGVTPTFTPITLDNDRQRPRTSDGTACPRRPDGGAGGGLAVAL
jgi:hypothetical protein